MTSCVNRLAKEVQNMLVFWRKITLPLLNWAKPKKIIEVGAELGGNTLNLLQYCRAAGAELFVIDPFPSFDVNEYHSAYPGQFHLRQNLSLDILPSLAGYDFVLLDGDHNWYTVYHELKAIESASLLSGKFPVVLLHDIEWPYGRRDMYYFPESIPDAFRHPYMKKGMIPGQSSLAETGGSNFWLNNAVFENGAKNGVLTAIEDFLQETSFNLSFHRVKSHYGLGILLPRNDYHDAEIRLVLAASGIS
jgi:hypothetical protein